MSEAERALFQGPPGRDGPQGPPGPIGGGQVGYSRTVREPGDLLAQRTRTPIAFTPDPALSSLYLNPPFAGLTLWDGARVRGRAFADRFKIQVNLLVRSMQANGTILLDVDAGVVPGSTPPLATDTADLFKDAGDPDPERVTLVVEFQTLDKVMANGAALFLTSTVPIHILKRSVLVYPESTFVGSST
ncbi:hypothetical protein [Methylobacterium haplocladii]|uniref:hypothetical protein n=1 Tax=Methylobacterium haplocladii TaxID=1176176 RepID=UPI0024E14D44|nr:hypothetical protein [Methylobacterium haplocladii]